MTPHRPTVNSAEVSSKVIDGEAVMINLSSGAYHSATGSGALAWILLERGHDRSEVAAAIADHYGVDADQVDTDLSPFLDDLRAQRLLVNGDGEAGPTPEPEPESTFPPGSYARPVLETYTDMADLLALDPPMPGLQDIPWSG